jgi:hypothetical protein
VPSLINGLGGQAGFGEGILGRNDDSSTGPINLDSLFPTGLNYFGTVHHNLFVNNNGNLTFAGPLSTYIPLPIGTNLPFPIIAAFWIDLDTNGGAQTPSPGGTSTGSNLVYYDIDTATRTFTATWDDVGYYSSHIGLRDAFQIQLRAVGESGDFDIIFRYETIEQDTSDTGGIARVGYSAGNGTGVEIDASGTHAVLNLDTDVGNTDSIGIYEFHVRNGVVIDPGEPPPRPEPPPIPRPVFFTLTGQAQQPEGNAGATPFAMTIHRSGDDLGSGSVVTWRVDIEDTHDLVDGQELSGTVEFSPGQTEAVVVINVQGDRVFEPDEYFGFQITTATHGAETWDPGLGGLAIILNDDPRTAFAFTGPQARPEGLTGSTPIEFMVMRTGDLTGASTVQWQLEPGHADAQDFATDQQLSGVVTFAPGASQAVIRIQIAGDSRVELDEDFTVRLTSSTARGVVTPITNAVTTGTILDDDARQTLLVATPGALVLPEGDTGSTAFNFNLMRVGDVSGAVDIAYTISLPGSGGASAGEILTPLTGVVSFAAGSSAGVLTVLVSGDTTPEDNESFLVTLGGGDFNTQYVSGVIMNDDKVVSSGASTVAPAPQSLPDLDVSAFMRQLAGGGLWPDGIAV